ncbi:GNAT family N-acetyltransferase [Kitasatospora aureofaciens]|uniref:GNAT family N-acetyltransferase n=1 Tax=Kitasatospora aureofaciens TaxID=1894 RepID=UPI001C4806DE|nr:GNAT family protein [Kitasatospora aureofaciens]MBV6699645.1 GNAT family N-acetyltransferase [Kitasatospora aureofaciens]
MTSFWTGERVRLRAIEPDDWSALMRFDEDSEYQRAGNAVSPPRSADWYRGWSKEQAAAKSDGDTFQLAVEALDTGELVGLVGSYEADPRAGRFTAGITIGTEYQRQGYAAEAAILLLRYMFTERRFHKCETRAYAYNEPSLALQRRLGFVEEGRLRYHTYQAGRHHDLVLMGMLAEEFTHLHPATDDTAPS